MNSRRTPHLLAALLSVVFTATLAAQTTAFTFQGRLDDHSQPADGAYDFQYALYDSATNGSVVGSTLTTTAVEVMQGVFTVRLDFGADVFNGADRWLEIGVRTNGGGAFSPLRPRHPITSTPYALKAASAMSVVMGAISDPSFIGTTTSTPLDLFVDNQRGLRMEFSTFAGLDSINIIGGYRGNTIGAETPGAVIAGGGEAGGSNRIGVDSDLSAIGGGHNNGVASDSWFSTIAGGASNDIGADSDECTIGGGFNNNIANNSERATIAGGYLNNIGVDSGCSTISGGSNNLIMAHSPYATIAGGQSNDIGVDSDYATIAGGAFNSIGTGASYAFATGRRARANHPGAFVWADSTDADFASTANNQFLIRASGGVGIGKFNPSTALDVNGTVKATAFAGNGSALTGLPDDHSLDAADGSPVNSVYVDSVGRVGVGTTAPTTRFTVSGAGAFNSATAASIILDNTMVSQKWQWHVLDNGNIQLADYTAGSTRMLLDADGNIGVGIINPSQKLHVLGNILATGTVTGSSDRNVKENFMPIDPQQVLSEVAAMPIHRWNYIGEKVPHIGPVAQDFHGAFQVGMDDKHISMVDADGVALAAIQGLNEKVEVGRQKAEVRNQKLEQQLEQKDAKITKLEARLDKLEQLLTGMLKGETR